jgi:hypothetical protein
MSTLLRQHKPVPGACDTCLRRARDRWCVNARDGNSHEWNVAPPSPAATCFGEGCPFPPTSLIWTNWIAMSKIVPV